MMAIQDFLSIRVLRGSGERRGDRVVAAAAPRVAPRQPREPEQQSAPGTMGADRPDEIVRARGLVPAAATGTAKRMERRRGGVLVNPREGDEQVFHSERAKIESRPARSNHSARRPENSASAAAGLATTTTRRPAAICGRHSLRISRRRRRILLRVTAPPTRRDVTMPTDLEPSDSFKTPTRKKRPWAWRPCSRTFLNSPLRRSLADFGKRSLGRSGLGVPCEVDFDTFREKALASVAPAAVEEFAALLGFHAGPETELPLPRALGRLVCAFHKKERCESARVGGAGRGSTRKSHRASGTAFGERGEDENPEGIHEDGDGQLQGGRHEVDAGDGRNPNAPAGNLRRHHALGDELP